MDICWLCEKYKFCNPLPPFEPDPDGLCVLHSFLLNKDKDNFFTENINKLMNNHDYNFTGVFFPESFVFENFEGTNKAIFDNTIFSEDAIFKGKEINCPIEFKETEF
jgi:hypothetical protein